MKRKIFFILFVLFFSCNKVFAVANNDSKCFDKNPVLRFPDSVDSVDINNNNKDCGISYNIGFESIPQKDHYYKMTTEHTTVYDEFKKTAKNCPNGKFNIFILIDDSDSMIAGRIRSMKYHLKRFAKEMYDNCSDGYVTLSFFHGNRIRTGGKIYNLGGTRYLRNFSDNIDAILKEIPDDLKGKEVYAGNNPIRGTNYIVGLGRAYRHFTSSDTTNYRPMLVFLTDGTPTTGQYDDWDGNVDDGDKGFSGIANSQVHYESAVAYYNLINLINKKNGIVFSDTLGTGSNAMLDFMLNPNYETSEAFRDPLRLADPFMRRFSEIVNASPYTKFYDIIVFPKDAGTIIFYPYHGNEPIGGLKKYDYGFDTGPTERWLCFGLFNDPLDKKTVVRLDSAEKLGEIIGSGEHQIGVDFVERHYSYYRHKYYYYCSYHFYNPHKFVSFSLMNKEINSGSFRSFTKPYDSVFNNYSQVALREGKSIISYNQFSLDKFNEIIDDIDKRTSKRIDIKVCGYEKKEFTFNRTKYKGLCKKGNNDSVDLGRYVYKGVERTFKVNYINCEGVDVDGGSLKDYIVKDSRRRKEKGIIAGKWFYFDRITVNNEDKKYVYLKDYGIRAKDVDHQPNNLKPLIYYTSGNKPPEFILYDELKDNKDRQVFDSPTKLLEIVKEKIRNKKYDIKFFPDVDFNWKKGEVDVEDNNGNIKAKMIGMKKGSNQFTYVTRCEDAVYSGDTKDCQRRFYYAPYGYNEDIYNINIKFISSLGNELKTNCPLNVITKGKPVDYVSYRSIDIGNPFPNNNKIPDNWSEWYRVRRNLSRLRDSYNKVFYSVNYNKLSNYKDDHDYSSLKNIDNSGVSSFVSSNYFERNNNKSYCNRGKWDSDCDQR